MRECSEQQQHASLSLKKSASLEQATEHRNPLASVISSTSVTTEM